MQLTESEVTTSRLADIFNQAFIDVLEINEKALVIKGDNSKIIIEVDTDRKFIRLQIIQALINIETLHLLQIINEMNSTMVMVRFKLIEHTGNKFLDADLYISFEKGLLANQLVCSLRFFEQIAVSVIIEKFKNNIP